METTDITAQAGKGMRKHRNASTSAYREGWEAIFGKRALPQVEAPAVMLRDYYWERLGSLGLHPDQPKPLGETPPLITNAGSEDAPDWFSEV